MDLVRRVRDAVTGRPPAIAFIGACSLFEGSDFISQHCAIEIDYRYLLLGCFTFRVHFIDVLLSDRGFEQPSTQATMHHCSSTYPHVLQRVQHPTCDTIVSAHRWSFYAVHDELFPYIGLSCTRSIILWYWSYSSTTVFTVPVS